MVLCNSLRGCLFLAFLLITYFPANYAQLENHTQPEVRISQGNLLGTTRTTRHNRTISAFLGIPFAQAPIGNLRFANPVAADDWNETLDASTDRKMCPQIGGSLNEKDEDCLYINVYTPQLPRNTNSSLFPVMVYIHGGAFRTGNQLSASAGPEYLLDADVVLVAPSYRLGALGFLSTGDEAASGNWGLKDQVLALEWVRDNVKYFGGNPDQVTIFGESAGAGSIHLLTLSDLTIGLFHRYITQSGSALAPWAYRPRAAYSRRAFELGEYVGCRDETSDSLISCLRTVNVSDIIAADLRLFEWKSFPKIIWGPTDEPDIEGAVLTDSPTHLFAAGKVRDLPSISGVVRDDGLVESTVFYQNKDMLDEFLEDFDTLLPLMLSWRHQSDSGAAWTKAAKSYYFNNDFTSNRSELLVNLTMLIGDALFIYPQRNALQQHHVLAENPQYFYFFDYRGTFSHTWLYGATTANYGVAHGDELMYLLPKDKVFSVPNQTMSELDYEMVDRVVQLWTSFAMNGTPTASALNGTTGWEAYSSADGYLRLGHSADVALEVEHAFFPERMRFWDNIDSFVEISSDNSVAAASSPNILFLFIVACSIFSMSRVTFNRLR